MTTLGREQAAIVEIGRCRCPGSPHTPGEGDLVGLWPKPPLAVGLASNGAITKASVVPDPQQPDVLHPDEVLLELYLGAVFVKYGVGWWNLVDEKARPLAITPDAVEERLSWDAGGAEVSEKATELYAAAVYAPLVRRSSAARTTGRRAPSTSATNGSSPAHPSSSRRSSRSTQAAGT